MSATRARHPSYPSTPRGAAAGTRTAAAATAQRAPPAAATAEVQRSRSAGAGTAGRRASSPGFGGRSPGGRHGMSGVSSSASRCKPIDPSIRSRYAPAAPASTVPDLSSSALGGSPITSNDASGSPRRTPDGSPCRARRTRQSQQWPRAAPARSKPLPQPATRARLGWSGRGATPRHSPRTARERAGLSGSAPRERAP